MAQPPFKADVLQIEPGSVGVRKIQREADGSLGFVDPVAGTLTLKALAGLNLTHLLIVGSGPGAQYTTIQDALDAIPAGASASNPYTVLVGPGVYAENVVLERDGVALVGLGNPVIHVATGHALTIQEGASSVPRFVRVDNIRLTTDDVAGAALRVIGGTASEVGATGIGLRGCDLRGATGKALHATSAGGISFGSGSLTGAVLVSNCTLVTIVDTGIGGATELSYDTGGTLPAVHLGYYLLSGCLWLLADNPLVTVGLVGGGSFRMLGCTLPGGLRLLGDRAAFEVIGSRIGPLTLDDTVGATFSGSWRGAVTAAAGTVLDEPLQQGFASFVAVDHVDVTFTVEQPDDGYNIAVDRVDLFRPSAKTTTGFTLTSTAGVVTTDVRWTVLRGPTN